MYNKINNKFDLITNVSVSDIKESIIASGYPMKKRLPQLEEHTELKDKDIKRAKQLASVASGSGHDCFLKGIIVSFDLTFSEKAWTQAERYTWFNFVSSMSTMHMLAKMEPVYMSYTDKNVIEAFTKVLKRYLANPTDENKLSLLYSYPSGLLLTARIMTNYLQLKTIYNQRKNHFLPEWREFCDWIQTLPKSYLITG